MRRRISTAMRSPLDDEFAGFGPEIVDLEHEVAVEAGDRVGGR